MISTKTTLVHKVAKKLGIENNEMAVKRLFNRTIWELEDMLQNKEKAKAGYERATKIWSFQKKGEKIK